MSLVLLHVAALLALVVPAAASNTWYVDVHGTPPGTGTLSDPYTSIQYAVAHPATLPWDTILVAPGNYVESVRADSKPLYLRSTAGPLLTTIQPTLTGSTVVLDHLSELEGFHVHPPFAYSPGPINVSVRIFEGSMRRCILTNSGPIPRNGVFVSVMAEITDCTITELEQGVAVSSFGGILLLRDSIVTGNQSDVILGGVAAAWIDYCAGIANLNPNAYGTGNLAGRVGFWDPARHDFHLRPGSPCIDAGDPSSPLDPDGSRHDIGALTYDPTYAPAPAPYCTGKLNSQGCVPAIGSVGSASASSGAPFVVNAANELANKAGLLLLGHDRQALPFQGALLCVTPPIKRIGAQVSSGAGGCTGTYAFDMAGYITSGANPALVPGALVDCQWWSRDPFDPTGFGTALSNALAFGIAP